MDSFKCERFDLSDYNVFRHFGEEMDLFEVTDV